MRKSIVTLAVGASLVLVPVTSAYGRPATTGAGAEYGHHVSTHAQEMGGFSGEMNPGDHRGFAGFDEHHSGNSGA